MEENINLWDSVEETTAQQGAEVEEETTEQAIAPETEEETEEEKPTDPEQPEQKLSAYEQAILAEMERRAADGDTLLADALNGTDKDIKQCFAYVKAQARKQAVAGCAMIEDSVVYGWAHHYYIESKETIEKECPELKPHVPKKVEKTAEQKKAEEQKKKVFENPLLASLIKKGAKIAEGEVAVTKTTEKKDEEGKVVSSRTTKTEANGTRTTTLVKDGQTYTMTEFSLF